MQKLFIIAGEASGDQLGAALLKDLCSHYPGVAVRGVGGQAMAAHGLSSIFPMQDLSLMGIAEVLPKIPMILKRLQETESAIREFAPDIVLTIDVPDFSKLLARRLQNLRKIKKIKIIHYVAPTVWAWRASRAKVMAKLFDHLFCLFPFEPPYFERAGLHATFVGHPIAQQANGDPTHLRSRLNIGADQPVVCLLPGSRRGEIEKLWPIFLAAFQKLKVQQPNLVAVIPTLPHLKPLLKLPLDAAIYILDAADDKHDAFALAAAQGGAIAASGTVSLELARANCPHLVAYKLHPLTYWIVKLLYKLPYVNLVNILAARLIVPEILQDNVTPDILARNYCHVMTKSGSQKLDFSEQMAKLKTSSDMAAKTLLQIAG